MFAAIANLTIDLRSNGSEHIKDLEDTYEDTSYVLDADAMTLETIILLREFIGKTVADVDMCKNRIFQFDATEAINKEIFIRFASKVKITYELLYDFTSERCLILFVVMKDQIDYCCVNGVDANPCFGCS